MLPDRKAAYFQNERLAHEILADSSQHVPIGLPTIDLFGILLRFASPPAMRGDFGERTRVHDPVVDLERSFAIPDRVDRDHGAQKRPCVRGMMQSDKEFLHNDSRGCYFQSEFLLAVDRLPASIAIGSIPGVRPHLR